ncbi:MAG: VanZ family protein [Gemmatimonadetes bacterium]|nr:VanZ family protein [Gemmatimonadota bacterium]
MRGIVAFWIRLAYLAMIAFATLAEPAANGDSQLVERVREALAPQLSGRDIVDAIRNVLLFAGWGAVWVITSPRGPARPMLVRAALTGAAISASVEGAQLLTETRVASILDLVTNTLGAIGGALVIALIVLVARAGHGRRSYLGVPAVLLAGGYGMSTLFEAFSPIARQQRLLEAWGPPLERLTLALEHLREAPIAALPLLDVVLFAPAGALAVAAWAEAGLPYGTAAMRVTLIGAIGYALAELGRGAAGYAIAPGAWLLHVAGLGAGALLAARWIPVFTREVRGRARPAAVIATYAGVLALWSLRPFVPEVDGRSIVAKLSPGRFIPLFAYRERVDVFTTADVIIPAFQFLAAGCLLAVWPLRRRGGLSRILPAVWLAGGLEVGQILVSGRTFDVTDILIASASAALGWAIVRRAGFEPYGEALAPRPASTAGHAPTQREPRS